MTIFVSGGIEEEALSAFARERAPIDGIGIGTSLATSSDAPALDCAYKLQEYAGTPRRKRSTGKATWPGRKQVWRRYDAAGRMASDVVSTEDDRHEGQPLIGLVTQHGRPVTHQPSLQDVRAYTRQQLERLPEGFEALKIRAPYPVDVGARLQQLAAAVDLKMK